VSNTSIKKSIL